MRRRPAVTLLEVLVAIFIMAIGLLALLVLFPLGALSMAEALQKDRTAAAAANASSLAEAYENAISEIDRLVSLLEEPAAHSAVTLGDFYRRRRVTEIPFRATRDSRTAVSLNSIALDS